MMKNLSFIILLISAVLSLFSAQTRVSGKILDEATQKPVSGAEIYINDSKKPSLKISGNDFEITSDSLIYKLTFYQKNYAPESVDITSENAQNLTVLMGVQKEERIQEVVLKQKIVKYKNKKENPAYAIMQEVWKRKKNNGLEKYDTYQYKEYEKIEIDLNNLDSAFVDKKIFNKLEFIFDYADSLGNGKLLLPVYLAESVYDNFGKNKPEKKQRKVMVAQKTSGFEGNTVVAMTAKNLYRDINIYDNIINYFDIGFQSPVGNEGFSTYNYNVIDTVTVRGKDVYQIIYEPKRKDVLAFQGTLWISTDNYAVVQATLKSTRKLNVNFVNGIYTELEYDDLDNETYLPRKLNTNVEMTLLSKNKGSRGMIAKKSVDYTDYQFNLPITDEVFEKKEEEFEPENLKKDDSYWQNIRRDSLTAEELGIYEMIGKLEETPKFKRLVKLTETVSSGYYHVGNAIDLGSIYSVYGKNIVEGDRIRLGARTYFSQNDMWRIQGYGAYGFKDEQFKYGAEAKYMFNKVNRIMIGMGTRRDILQLGVSLTSDDGIMSRSFASSSVFGRGENASLSSVNQTNIFSSIEPFTNYQIRLDGTMQSIKSANPDHFSLYYNLNGGLRKTVNDSHLTLSLIARPGAKYSETGVDRWEHSTLAPTFVLKYTKGIEGLFNADFNYNKLQFMYYQPVLIGSWGKSFLNFEVGKNFNTVPLALQNVIPGNQSYSLAANTFAQLNYYEFVADQYATGHLEHHFNGKILSFIPLIKKLKLREVAFIRAAYGTLSEESKNINVEGWRYSAPSKNIYYEYGFGIENIGFGNLRIFRVDFNWRGNYLQNPDVSKFGIKFGFQFFY